jgi:hypothetical protein
MVKEPRLGAVKTRLARDIAPAAAVRFYRCAAANLIRRLAGDPRWRTVLAIAPDRALAAACWPPQLTRIGQGAGDLGQRMERLLRAGPVVLIGSDIPGMRGQHIAEAFALLRSHDAVFGPAEDGGFWLVGVNGRPHLRGLFDGVRWSSPHALRDTLDNLIGWRVGFAARLADVDDGCSYRRHGHLAARITLPVG